LPGDGLAGGAASAWPAKLPRARNSPQAVKRLWDDLIDLFFLDLVRQGLYATPLPGPYFGGATSAWAVRIFPLSGSKIASVRWCGCLRSFSRVS
jgi:hypothetical protein